MTFRELWLLNLDWLDDSVKIKIYDGPVPRPDVMTVRLARSLYGERRVLCFDSTSVSLCEDV